MATATIQTTNLEELIQAISFGMLSDAEAVETKIFGKSVLQMNALHNKKLAESYWRLDSNAFGGTQPAPIFMKLDALIIGGLPVVMLLANELTDSLLVKELGAQDLEYVPIGFMDLHKKSEGIFAVSGLGISKQYQGNGLSKLLIYGGIKIAGAKELFIPTQLSNAAAHYSWLHLSPLEVVSADVFHNESDTIVYNASIPKEPEKILETHTKKKGVLVPFKKVRSYWKTYDVFPPVIGYRPGTKGGLYVDEKHMINPCRCSH